MIDNSSENESPCSVCSMFAFDRNPKIPNEVININTTTLVTRYHFCHLILSQNKCKYAAVTSLPNSNTPAITTTSMYAPANIVARPITEKYAAMNAINIEVDKAR